MTARFCLAASQVTLSATSLRLSPRPQNPEAVLLPKWNKLPRRILSFDAACVSQGGAVALIAGEPDTPELQKGEESIQNHTERDLSDEGDAAYVKTGAIQAPVDALRQVSIHDLRIGSLYKGRVTSIESYGAFVDIGAYFHGFVHISRLSTSFVRRVEDVVQVGQDVTVQILDLDLHASHMSLVLRPDEGFEENIGLLHLPFSARDFAHRVAVRRANKLARQAQDPLPRRRTSLETRRRLKAYRRTAMAERQAIELYRVKTKASSSSLGAGSYVKTKASSSSLGAGPYVDINLQLSSNDECRVGDSQIASSGSPKGVSTGDEVKPTQDDSENVSECSPKVVSTPDECKPGLDEGSGSDDS